MLLDDEIIMQDGVYRYPRDLMVVDSPDSFTFSVIALSKVAVRGNITRMEKR